MGIFDKIRDIFSGDRENANYNNGAHDNGKKPDKINPSDTVEVDFACTDDPVMTEPQMSFKGENGVRENSASENSYRECKIVFFRLLVNNCQIQSSVYEGEIGDDRIRLAHLMESSRWIGNESITDRKLVKEIEGEQDLREKVIEIIDSCKVLKWNGFKGENPKGVMDGSSMIFEARLADGSTISASGTNNFPKHYSDFESAIYKLISYGEVTSTDFSYNALKMILPENWVNRVETTFGNDYVCFSLRKGDKSAPLVRVDYSETGYGHEKEDYRVGRIQSKSGEKCFFVEIHQFDSFYNVKDLLDEEETKLCTFATTGNIQELLAKGMSAVEGYELLPENGEILYDFDASFLLDRATSIWLSLMLGGDYASSCKLLELDGKKYKSYSPTYEHPSVSSEADLRKRMALYFDEKLIDEIIEKKKAAGAILEADYLLYVDYAKVKYPTLYGGKSIVGIKQDNPDSAVISVSVMKATPEDEAYRYSDKEIFDFDVIRNKDGRYVFKNFDYWIESVWE